MFRQIINFILQLTLWLIGWILQPIVEIATFLVVAVKYRLNALNYFNGKGLEADYRSARDNRALWNFLLVGKNGVRYTRDIKKTISRLIGINSYREQGLSWIGWLFYVVLYIVDISKWLDWGELFKNGKIKRLKGHCRESMKKEDNNLKTDKNEKTF